MTGRKAAWRKTTIHTPRELERKGQRLNKLNRDIENALAELRRGASLHLSYSPRRHWRLSSGAFITDEVARVLITSCGVASVGDSLFTGELAQTWRYMEVENV